MSLLLFSGLTLFKHSWDSKNFCWASFNWLSDDVNNSISWKEKKWQIIFNFIVIIYYTLQIVFFLEKKTNNNCRDDTKRSFIIKRSVVELIQNVCYNQMLLRLAPTCSSLCFLITCHINWCSMFLSVSIINVSLKNEQILERKICLYTKNNQKSWSKQN